MAMAIRAMLLTVCLSVCAHAQTRTLALYPGPVRGLDDESRLALQTELQRLLTPAGLDVVWKHATGRRAGEDFDFVAVVSFEGGCSSVSLATAVPAAAAVASLADTSVAGGRVLPFFNVDCGRLATLLRAELEPLHLRSRQALFGRALARVMAHEIYHIVGQTAGHQDRGVAKATFSIRDLTSPRFEFDLWSLTAMKPPSVATVIESDSADTGR
jgi:hypothetical protein